MRMYTNKKRTRKKPWVIAGILLAVLIVWLTWPEDDAPQAQPTIKEGFPDITTTAGTTEPDFSASRVQTPTAEKTPAKAPVKKPAYGPKGMTVSLAKQIGPSILTVRPKISSEEANKQYAAGWILYKNGQKLLEARTRLNMALNSGHLNAEKSQGARRMLENLASRTIFNKSSYVNPKDPYLISYKFASGDSLNSKRNSSGQITRPGIISRYNLCVPWRIIPYINGLGYNATRFKAGQNYKLVKGPFHVVAYKSKRVADIYLRDLFIKRVPIAIGKPETPTPEGFFRVVCWNGKTANSTYYPPAEMGGPCIPVRPGEPDYPLGPKGYNIKIEGIPQLGTNILASQSYALHGTNVPASLGTAASRGCLRFGDKDIEFLYASLMDYADPNNPKANWKHWSTVTIRP